MVAKTPEQIKAELLKTKLRGVRPRGTGTGGDLVSGLSGFGRGVNRALLRTIGIVPKEEAGPVSIDLPTNIFSKTHPLGLGRREGEEFVGRVGEEVGSNLPFMGAAQKAAPVISELAETGTNVVQRAFGNLAKGVTQTPGRATVGETVATVGSGTGAATAQEIAPGNRLAEMGGQLAGGVGVPLIFTLTGAVATKNIVSRLIAKYGKNAISATTGSIPPESAQKIQQALGSIPMVGPRTAKTFKQIVEESNKLATQTARKKVRDELAALAGKEFQPNVIRAGEVESAVPGTQLSIGQRTQNPYVMMRELDMQKYMTPAEVMAMHTRFTNNDKALQKFVWSKRPQSDLSPEYIIKSIDGSITSERLQTEELVKMANEQQQQLAESLPDINLADIGKRLRELQISYREKAQADLAEMRESLGLNEVDLSAPFNDWRNAVVQKYQGRAYTEADLGSVLNYLQKVGKPNVAEQMAMKETDTPFVITWDDLQFMDQQLGDAWRSARAGEAPNFAKARAIAEMQKDVTSFMDSLDSQLGANYTQYKTAYREKLIEPFRDKAAFEVTARNGRGFYKTYDEEVASSYFYPGGISDIRKFKQIYGDDSDANRALEAVVLDDLRNSAVVDGVINKTRLNTWLNNHESVLRETPAIKDKVSTVQRANEFIVERQKDLNNRLREINDQKLSRIIKSVNRLELTPEGGIAQMLRDPRLMQKAWDKMDGKGKEALRRHVWDSVIDQDGDKIQQFIQSNADALSVIYDDRAMENLLMLGDAKHIIDLIPKPALPKMEFSPSAELERTIGMSLPVLGSRLQALNTGRASKTWVMADALGRFTRGHSEQDIINAWKEAIWDPKLAEEIVEFSIKPTRAKAKRLHTRFFLLGIPTEYEEKQEDEVDYMAPAVPFSESGIRNRTMQSLGGMR